MEVNFQFKALQFTMIAQFPQIHKYVRTSSIDFKTIKKSVTEKLGVNYYLTPPPLPHILMTRTSLLAYYKLIFILLYVVIQ